MKANVASASALASADEDFLIGSVLGAVGMALLEVCLTGVEMVGGLPISPLSLLPGFSENPKRCAAASFLFAL